MLRGPRAVLWRSPILVAPPPSAAWSKVAKTCKMRSSSSLLLGSWSMSTTQRRWRYLDASVTYCMSEMCSQSSSDDYV